MKRFAFYMVFVLLASCSRDANFQGRMIDGTWYMWYVEDRSIGVVTPKPVASDDVLITFASTTDTTGVFYGKTPANQISPSPYFISPTRVDLHAGGLQIPTLSITSATETTWGKLFIDNVLKANEYAFETDNHLYLFTQDSMLITFKRL